MDIQRLIDKILLHNWTGLSGQQPTIGIDTNETKEIIYNYTCINLMETKFYKASSSGWKLIGGLCDIKSSLIETLIWPIKYKNLYKRLKMKQSGGVLLYGPSGCGKTLIASALASESKFNFISVKGPELLSKYIGSSEQNVRELFTKAQKAKPCIIFFDEFDSLAPKRGHDSTGVTDRVVNQLLTQLDGVEQLDGVYLLAASSRPDLIDQALLRPGRVDSFLYIGYPGNNELKETFEIYCAGMQLNNVDFSELSEMCVGFTGADVKSVACDALLKSFHRVKVELDPVGKGNEADLRSKLFIEREDFVTSIEEIKQTIDSNERNKLTRMYKNWTVNKSFSDPHVKEHFKNLKAKATLA